MVGAAVGHGAVGKVHLSGRPQKNKMDVLKGEEGKRVASGGAALSADEGRAALPGAVSRVANWPRGRSVLESVVFQSRDKRQ